MLVVPALVQCLTNTDSGTALVAAYVLGQMASEGDITTSAFTRRAQLLDRGARESSRDSIRNLGNACQTALPALLQALRGDYKALRGAAFEAIMRIAPPEFEKRLDELDRIAEQTDDQAIKAWLKKP